MDEQLVNFWQAVTEYYKHTSYEDKHVKIEDLATSEYVSMDRSTLSRKIHGKAKITNEDVHGIIKALAGLGCIKSKIQAKELLEIMNASDFSFGNWSSEPLSSLSSESISPIDRRNHSSIGKSVPKASEKDSALRQHINVWFTAMYNDAYYPLPKRESLLIQLLEELENSNGSPAIAVDGLGGMGKTSFAVELAKRALADAFFENVVGDTAKQEYLIGGEIVQLNEATLNFHQLVDSIARQLELWEILAFEQEKKQNALAHVLKQHRYLILIDNLETAENAQMLVARLREFLGSSRAIITSKEKVYHDFVQSSSLHGLELDDSLIFLTEELKRIKRQHALISQEKLIEFHMLTGGAPLALKLVIAQTQFLPIEVILRQLKQATGNLYTFIFRQSWEQLSYTAQNVLIYIGKTVASTSSVEWGELVELASLETFGSEDVLVEAVEQLVNYSLLDVSFSGEEVEYSIHQLTSQFVTNDLPQIWKDKGLL